MLARCHRALSTLIERSIVDLGLGGSDFMVLEALLHKGPLTISEIQGKVLLASGSMTAAADRLEEKGFVVRKFAAGDRRVRMLHLTASGKRAIEGAYTKHTESLGELMSVLSPAEKGRLYGPLKKLGKFAAEKLGQEITK